MADVWRTELSCDGIVVTGHLPNPVFDGFPVLAYRVFIAQDSTAAGIIHGASLAIEVSLQNNTYGGGGTFEWRASYRALQKPFPSDPFNDWVEIFDPMTGLPLIINEADGNNGASFLSGGTLAITKDLPNNRFLFDTPLGQMIAPFSWFSAQPFGFPSWTPNGGPLVANGFGAALAFADDSLNNSTITKWFNFYTKKNGTIVQGWALSAADPGFFNPAFRNPFVPPPVGGYLTSGGLIPTNSGQELTRYREQLLYTAGDFAHEAATDEQRYTMMGAGALFGLDVTNIQAHNLTLGAWTPTPTTLKVRRSDDDGHTWTEFTAATGTDSLAAVSVHEFGGAFIVAYWDTTTQALLQTNSRDTGLTWSTPVPVGITGNNPRLVVTSEGVFCYFYLDNSGNLLLRRSFDFGATLFDGSPLTVAATVPMQDFAGVLTADRALLIAYADAAGNWVTRISRDLGLTWATA